MATGSARDRAVGARGGRLGARRKRTGRGTSTGSRCRWAAGPSTSTEAALPHRTLEELERLDGWVMGPHDSASYPEPHRSQFSPSGLVPRHFDLFANIRPARSFPGSEAVQPGADLVIMRENTQGFYADRNTFLGTGEWMPSPEVAIARAVFTRPSIERITRVAFAFAKRRKRRLTVVHKANCRRVTTGLFRSIAAEVAPEHPDVTVDDFHIDAMTVHLMRRAEDFDVLLTENMFGDILSDLAGAISGRDGSVAERLGRRGHGAGVARLRAGIAGRVSPTPSP